MTFRLDDYKDLLEEVARLNRRSMTDQLKFLIDQCAVSLGLEPMAPLPGHPKKKKGKEES